MDRKLHLLETFVAQDEHGASYKVFGYEHLVKMPSAPEFPQHWEPTGIAEYKLADGEHVDLQRDGTLRIAKTGRPLTRP
jgi:hypothetical protein